MYKLSRVIQGHKRDVRCIDYFEGVLVTGGNDKVFNLYNYQSGNYTLITTSDIFGSEIISCKINRLDKQSPVFVLLGCRNGKIYAFDQVGNPTLELTHETTISSIDFIDQDHFVTGSWDGKAIVWNIKTQKKVSEYAEHKYAVSVFYNQTTGHVISGSQDKALNVWDWKTGSKIRRVDNAHGDIIREIADVDGSGMIITCSNDESLKLWSADLDLIETFSGHSAFVFAVKAIALGSYVSGSEDKSVKIWGESSCVQDIQMPASVWSIAIDENKDLFIGGSDGVLRTFTTSEERRAEPDVE